MRIACGADETGIKVAGLASFLGGIEMSTAGQRTRSDLSVPGQDRRLLARTAVIGIAMFVVGFGTFAPESSPEAGSSTAAQIRNFAAENAGTIRLNTLCSIILVVLLVFFVACLAQQVRETRGATAASFVLVALSALGSAGMMALAAATSIFGLPEQLAMVSDMTVVTMYDFAAVAQWLYTLTVVGPCMVLVATYSWLALRLKLMARWVSFAGFAIVAAGAFTLASLTLPDSGIDIFVIVLFGWWLWPLAVGGAVGVRWLRTR